MDISLSQTGSTSSKDYVHLVKSAIAASEIGILAGERSTKHSKLCFSFRHRLTRNIGILAYCHAMTIYADLPEITVNLDGSVAVMKLNRPAAKNAFTNRMKDSIVAAMHRLDHDDRVKVILLTSEPNASSIFCAGADLSGGGNFSSDNRYSNAVPGGGAEPEEPSHNSATTANDHRDGGGQTALAIHALRKPSIVAINGHSGGGNYFILPPYSRKSTDLPDASVGIGMTMTLPFDIRLAWSEAKIGFVFSRRGIVPEATSSYFLPRLIGHSRAMELFMVSPVSFQSRFKAEADKNFVVPDGSSTTRFSSFPRSPLFFPPSDTRSDRRSSSKTRS